MESFREQNIGEPNSAREKIEIALNENEKTGKVLEEYLYKQEKEIFDHKDLRQLARLESEFTRQEDKKGWPVKKEAERCELKKKLEKTLSGQEPKKVSEFWKTNESEFCDSFGRARGREAETQFSLLKSGVRNEIIAAKILGKIPDLEVRMSSSETDIHKKIDFFCIRGETILAVQVKSKSRKDMKRGRDEVVESVGVVSSEPKKNEFIAGCSALEKELDLKNRGIELRKVWLIIPLQDKIGDGGEFNHQLGKEVELGVAEILRK